MSSRVGAVEQAVTDTTNNRMNHDSCREMFIGASLLRVSGLPTGRQSETQSGAEASLRINCEHRSPRRPLVGFYRTVIRSRATAYGPLRVRLKCSLAKAEASSA